MNVVMIRHYRVVVVSVYSSFSWLMLILSGIFGCVKKTSFLFADFSCSVGSASRISGHSGVHKRGQHRVWGHWRSRHLHYVCHGGHSASGWRCRSLRKSSASLYSLSSVMSSHERLIDWMSGGLLDSLFKCLIDGLVHQSLLKFLQIPDWRFQGRHSEDRKGAGGGHQDPRDRSGVQPRATGRGGTERREDHHSAGGCGEERSGFTRTWQQRIPGTFVVVPYHLSFPFPLFLESRQLVRTWRVYCCIIWAVFSRS